MGAPNASRCLAYVTDSSTHPCANPTASALIAIRPSSSVERNCAYPRPRSPRTFSAGTLQFANDNSRVSLACQPTLSYFLDAVKPSCGTGTMIEVSSGRPSARSPVRHRTVTRLVIFVPALVMKALLPLMTQSSPSRTAVVLELPASDPPPGSV